MCGTCTAGAAATPRKCDASSLSKTASPWVLPEHRHAASAAGRTSSGTIRCYALRGEPSSFRGPAYIGLSVQDTRPRQQQTQKTHDRGKGHAKRTRGRAHGQGKKAHGLRLDLSPRPRSPLLHFLPMSRRMLPRMALAPTCSPRLSFRSFFVSPAALAASATSFWPRVLEELAQSGASSRPSCPHCSHVWPRASSARTRLRTFSRKNAFSSELNTACLGNTMRNSMRNAMHAKHNAQTTP